MSATEGRYHANFGTCPITGRAMRRRQIHTRHDWPGVYNACGECDPDSLTLAASLRALDRKRRHSQKRRSR